MQDTPIVPPQAALKTMIGDRPAPRVARLIAYLIDQLVLSMVAVGFIFYFELWPYLLSADPAQMTILYHPIALQFLLFALINGYFLLTNGQTLGKLIMGIRVVGENGQVPSLRTLLLIRSFLFFYLPLLLTVLVSMVSPAIGAVVHFISVLFVYINILFIFKPGARCLHDRLAKTYVVVCDQTATPVTKQ